MGKVDLAPIAEALAHWQERNDLVKRL